MPSATITSEQREIIYQLARRITGACQTGKLRSPLLVSNVARRMSQTGYADLEQYLQVALENDREYPQLVSALTIHTTRWFRELPHFEALEQEVLQRFSSGPCSLNILCAACSTGEEPYSIAMILESYRRLFPQCEYRIYAFDIDPVSVQSARASVYDRECLAQIPQKFQHLVWHGRGKTAHLIAPSPELRQRVSFAVGSILEPIPFSTPHRFDVIFCRNVLIYFEQPDANRALKGIVRHLTPDGRLYLGHSDVADTQLVGIEAVGHATYKRLPRDGEPRREASPRLGTHKSVLVVDDCPVTRKLLRRLLENEQFYVETVESTTEANQLVKERSFDAITLDVHLRESNGATWLQQLRKGGNRTPVIIVSGTDEVETGSVVTALEYGAQDVLAKSQLSRSDLLAKLSVLLTNEGDKVDFPPSPSMPLDHFEPEVILAGASTGGIEALCTLLSAMPSDSPPVVFVQHIPASFAGGVAERIAQVSKLTLGRTEAGEPLRRGHIYAAFGDYHIGIARQEGTLVLQIMDGPPHSGHRPSVDLLFQSAAELVPCRVYAMLLTGMGSDGAQGLLTLRAKGAVTFAQDRTSSIIFGMPGEAARLGAAAFIGPPTAIRRELDRALASRS